MPRSFRAAVPLCVLASALWSEAVSGQPRSWEPRKKPHAVRALCVVRDSGKVDCVRIEDLRRILSPDLMDKVDQVMRDILEDFGLDTTKNALFECRGEWRATNLDLQSATKARTGPLFGRSSGRSLPSPADAQGMVRNCQQSLRAEIETSLQSAGIGRSQMVAETVARMDEAVAECQDRSSPVAEGSSQWAVDLNQARSDYEAAKNALIDRYPGSAVRAGDTNAIVANASLHDAETLRAIIESELARNRFEKESPEKRTERNFLIALLQDLAEEVKELVDKPVPPAPVPTNPSTAPAPTPAPAPTQPPSSTSTPCDPGMDCKPSCSEIQERWAKFKDYCEQSGWRAYQCEAFLRLANGCVDMTLINPGPEGDMTCPPRAKVDKAKEAYLAACRKRKWIAIPSGDRDILCTAPDFQGVRPGFDPCNDPRVMPDPESCFGGRGGVAPERQRTPPGPERPN
jgi:hypothetical protein